eukprot:TRINITY_DN9566_c0_g3_i2.p1 TRINITY_DN9566_c0_g3~~TRINITY_DN9566_c0_g3_i2.p1  ORF type:complete len:762 (+),score=154.71 TRINITY_DN9566_c0_g3_i2:174-2459(+)
MQPWLVIAIAISHQLAIVTCKTIRIDLKSVTGSFATESSFSHPLSRKARALGDIDVARSELEDLFSTALISWPDTDGSSMMIVTQRFGTRGVAESHVYSSQNMGRNWSRATAVPDNARIRTLVSSSSPDNYYLVGADTIYTTSDGGLTFNQVITTSGTISEFAVHPTRSDVFTYATDGQLHVAFNNGAIVRNLLDRNVAELDSSEWMVLSTSQVKLVALYQHPTTGEVGLAKYKIATDTLMAEPVALPPGAPLLINTLDVRNDDIFVQSSIARQRSWVVAYNDNNTFAKVLGPSASQLTILANNMDVMHYASDQGVREDLYALVEGSFQPLLLLRNLNCVGTTCDLVCSSQVSGLCLANQEGTDVTLRTIDGGQTWTPLTTTDPAICGSAAQCNLRLLMDVARTVNRLQFDPTAFSFAAAYLVYGLVNPSSGRTVTVVSNDGGVTWSTAVAKAQQIQAIDHGAVLLTADIYQPRTTVGATNVTYSLDEGRTFGSVQATEKEVHMIAVLTHPRESSAAAIVVGYDVQPTNNTFTWVVLSIDFTQALGRPCQTDDFSPWSLTEIGCTNGLRQTFDRRMPNRTCLVGSSFDSSGRVAICPCQRSDYVCGEQLVTVDGTCQLAPDACSADNSTLVDRYQLGLLNRCQGGLQLDNKVEVPQCPTPASSTTSNSRSNTYRTVLIVFGVAAVGLIIVVLVVKQVRNRAGPAHPPTAFENPMYEQRDPANDEVRYDLPAEDEGSVPQYADVEGANPVDDGGYMEVEGYE